DRRYHVNSGVAAFYFKHDILGDLLRSNKLHLVYRRYRLEFTASEKAVFACVYAHHLKLAYLLEALAGHRQLELPIKVDGPRRVFGHRGVIATTAKRLISDLLIPDHCRRLYLFDNGAAGCASHQKHQPGVRKSHRGL